MKSKEAICHAIHEVAVAAHAVGPATFGLAPNVAIGLVC